MSVRPILAALIAALALGACGVKGDPVRPGTGESTGESAETETED